MSVAIDPASWAVGMLTLAALGVAYLVGKKASSGKKAKPRAEKSD